jgi:CheY-like chemotaxis protein
MEHIPANVLDSWIIVAIDDEEDSLELVEEILLAYGAEVYTASDGQKGIEIIRSAQPKLVITDISMPNIDGWGVMAAVRKDPVLAGIPVIALTAHAMVGDRDLILDAGFSQYMTKPITVPTFMSTLVECISAIPVLANDLKR